MIKKSQSYLFINFISFNWLGALKNCIWPETTLCSLFLLTLPSILFSVSLQIYYIYIYNLHVGQHCVIIDKTRIHINSMEKNTLCTFTHPPINTKCPSVPSIVLDIRDKEEERNAHKWYGGNVRSKENKVSQAVQREWGSYNNSFLKKVTFKLRADWSIQVSHIKRRE